MFSEKQVMAKKSVEELVKETRGAAAAFLEDLTHIREVLNRAEPDKGEVRRLSNVLRRLLVDNGGDLSGVAAPRLGRYELSSFDNAIFFRAERKAPFIFFQSGGASVYGVFMRAAMVDQGNKSRSISVFNPEQTIPLRLDNFLSQNVLCLNGIWASRRGVIKYIANIASGVHTGQPKGPEEILLNRIRHVAKHSLQIIPPGIVAPESQTASKFLFDLRALSEADMELKYDPKALDPVLVELIAVAHLLLISPDIAKLEQLVKLELGAQS